MYKIGITGGIGSGKSTVSRLLAEYANIPIVDADQIARKLVEPGQIALDELVNVFGQEILTQDGVLDRKKLGDIIFNDDEQRIKLNEIMFPIICAEAKRRFDELELLGNTKYVIFDAPLLFESGSVELINYVVVVYAPQDIQIKRIQSRNNITKEEAQARVASQASIDEVLKYPADFLVRNTVSFNVLKSMIGSLWMDIKTRYEGQENMRYLD